MRAALALVIALSLCGCVGREPLPEIKMKPGEALQLAEPVRVLVVRVYSDGRQEVGYVNATTDNLLGAMPAEMEDESVKPATEKKLAAQW